MVEGSAPAFQGLTFYLAVTSSEQVVRLMVSQRRSGLAEVRRALPTPCRRLHRCRTVHAEAAGVSSTLWAAGASCGRCGRELRALRVLAHTVSPEGLCLPWESPWGHERARSPSLSVRRSSWELTRPSELAA